MADKVAIITGASSGIGQAAAQLFAARGAKVVLTARRKPELASPELFAFVQGLHALKRIASPVEIAQAALFLCSNAASFITGAAIPVDGGVSITRT